MDAGLEGGGSRGGGGPSALRDCIQMGRNVRLGSNDDVEVFVDVGGRGCVCLQRVVAILELQGCVGIEHRVPYYSCEDVEIRR